jgi:voltage-gated potassium channel
VSRIEQQNGRRRFLPLLLSLIVLFLLYPLLVELGRVRLFRFAIVGVLILAVYALSERRRLPIIALVLVLPSIAFQLLVYLLPGRAEALTAGVLSALFFLGFTTVVILRSVLETGPVTGDRIAGAVVVYLLMGLVWMLIYALVAVVDPGAFQLPGGLAGQLGEGGEYTFLFFSFVTLTTLGYGDITPLTPAGQTAAWFEAATGQLYLAILIARLVGLHLAHSALLKGKPGSDKESA